MASASTTRFAVLDGRGLWVRRGPPPRPVGTDLLLRVRAAGLCGSDIRLARRYLEMADRGTAPPAVRLGHELVGEVLSTGSEVSGGPPPGTRVAALPCVRRSGGLEWFGESPVLPGAFGDACLADAELCVPVPDTLSDSAAVFVEPLAVGVHAVARADLRPWDRPIVFGCGPLGLATILALQHAGVTNVLAVERDTRRAALAEKAGATVRPSLTGACAEPDVVAVTASRGGRPVLLTLPDVVEDPRVVIFECAGEPGSLPEAFRAAPTGTLVIALGVVEECLPLPVLEGVRKQLSVRFVVVYNLSHFITAVEIASARSEILNAFVIKEVSMEELSRDWLRIVCGPQNGGKLVVRP